MKKLIVGLVLILGLGGTANAHMRDTFNYNGYTVTPVCVEKVNTVVNPQANITLVSYRSFEGNGTYFIGREINVGCPRSNTYTFKHICSQHNKPCNAYMIYDPQTDTLLMIYKYDDPNIAILLHITN